MNFALIKNKIRYGSFFIPFRFQLILLSITLFAAYYWLKKTRVLPDASYSAITELFITVTMAFIACVFVIAFFSSVLPWLYFLYTKRNRKIDIKIKTDSKQNTLNEKQRVSININPIIRPVFGYIRLRLHYDGENISSKFSLINTQQKQDFFSSSLNGIYNWPLPEIKEYKISNAIIYFEDMFQLFSFAATLPAQDNFFTHPKNVMHSEMKVRPKKTEEANTRIDRIRKLEGEFLNYKNFENNDDVRRIVWKIYAKNKELVVRIPETNDPYASHVYFYASYYNSMESGIYGDFYPVLLNYYKTGIWNVYSQLSKQNVLIKYIPDQETKTTFIDDATEKIKYIISTSDWQTQKDLQQYFKKEDASVICFSSLINAEQVDDILSGSGKDLVVIFVQLSNSFNAVKIKDWVKWIFIKPADDGLNKLRMVWNISPFKRKLIENENKIKAILNKSESEIIIV
ncbi:MAG: DUF58 domain-containing protein [Bacteroidota bacterium]|nr:DUF58 domain-containing protein [Bacteroidota bacterium]